MNALRDSAWDARTRPEFDLRYTSAQQLKERLLAPFEQQMEQGRILVQPEYDRTAIANGERYMAERLASTADVPECPWTRCGEQMHIDSSTDRLIFERIEDVAEFEEDLCDLGQYLGRFPHLPLPAALEWLRMHQTRTLTAA